MGTTQGGQRPPGGRVKSNKDVKEKGDRKKNENCLEVEEVL